MDDQKQKLKMARVVSTAIEPTLESAVLRMTYQMYALLNAVSICVFFLEIVWDKFSSVH